MPSRLLRTLPLTAVLGTLLAVGAAWLETAGLEDGRVLAWLQLSVVRLGPALALAFAVALAVVFARRRDGVGGPRRSLALVLLPVALVVAANRARPDGPNVIVILVDVLRADELGCYGYERDTTPHIDEFAKDAVLFENAIAQSTFTKTSVASLFTGVWPHRHGVYTGSLEDDEGNISSDVLSPRFTTIAESLAAAGYQTAAWVRNDQLRDFMGFGQGFGVYDDRPGRMHRAFAEFEEWTDRRAARGPFFVYLHLLELHAPYVPESPWDTRFGTYLDGFDPMSSEEWIHYKTRVRRGEYVPDPSETQQLRALYDGQLAFVDERIGAFLERLRERGLYDDSLIVFLADHGDAFMEHGFLSHSNSPFDELIRVPLLVKLPGARGAGRRVSQQVALVDLAPTFEELLGASGIGSTGDGRSLVPFLGDREPEAVAGFDERPVLSMFKGIAAARTGRWKVIHNLVGDRALFDLVQDPGESENLAREQREVAMELVPLVKEALEAKLAHQADRVELDEETTENLRDLGYIE